MSPMTMHGHHKAATGSEPSKACYALTGTVHLSRGIRKKLFKGQLDSPAQLEQPEPRALQDQLALLGQHVLRGPLLQQEDGQVCPFMVGSLNKADMKVNAVFSNGQFEKQTGRD